MKNNFTRNSNLHPFFFPKIVVRQKNMIARRHGHFKWWLAVLYSLVASFTTLFAQPQIKSVVPMRGPAGSEVHIFASGFDTSYFDNNIVYFGAAKARVLGFSPDKSFLSVLVPNGATYAPISLTVKRQTAYTQQKFELSFRDSADLTEGAFATPGVFPAGENINCEKIALGDFNMDGKVDVATLGYTLSSSQGPADISVFKNTSTVDSIQFNCSQIYHTGLTNLVLNVADIDGDGKLDLITSRARVNGWVSFLVFRNKTVDGKIAFEDPKIFSLPGAGKINIGDIDMDGKPDVVYWDRDSVFFLKNKSQNAIISFGKPTNLNIKGGRILEIADYNNDGKPDLAIYNDRNFKMYFYANASAGGFVAVSFSTSLQLSSRFAERAVVSGDYTGDGRMDVAVLDKQEQNVALIRNKGAQFGAIDMDLPIIYSVKSDYPAAGALALSDVNGDGKPDLIVGKSNLSLAVLQNAMASDRFLFKDALYFDALKIISDMAVGDINGDGKPDIVMGHYRRNFISVLKNQVAIAKAAPAIASFNPAAGLFRDTIMITGKNFIGAQNVLFGGKNALSYTVVSDSLIAAVVDVGATGDVTVVNNIGAVSKAGFTFLTAPVIRIFTDSVSVCGGAPVKIEAYVEGRYPSYYYYWYKNGQRVGELTKPYITTHLQNGDSVYAIVLNNRAIRKSNILVFNVTPVIKPTIRISANKRDAICKDSAVIFTAITTNAGSNPIYQWMKNNQQVGMNAPTYTDRNLLTGDSVYCILTVPEKCAITPVISKALSFQVYDRKPATPIAILGPQTVSEWQLGITYFVEPVPGAISYQWQIPMGANWASDKNKDSIKIDWGNRAGKISVVARNVCGASPFATKIISLKNLSSKENARSVNKNGTVLNDEVAGFIVYPNPATSSVTIAGRNTDAENYVARLIDASGKVIKTGAMKSKIVWTVSDIAPGLYYIVITEANKIIANKELLIGR